MGADRVEKGDQDALFHELVNLGHCFIQRRWMRRYIRLGQAEQIVTDFGGEIDLSWARLADVGIYQSTPQHEYVGTLVGQRGNGASGVTIDHLGVVFAVS